MRSKRPFFKQWMENKASRYELTSYSKTAVSMIPLPLSENLPTSQPKKTGCPALIIYTYKIYEFQI